MIYYLFIISIIDISISELIVSIQFSYSL